MSGKRPVEPPLMRRLMQKAMQRGIPASGAFELTPVCNFSCRMCYIRKTPAQVEASDRPILSLNRWLALAEECERAGTLNLLLTGGEPLVLPYFKELYEKLFCKGFLLSINTNGSLVDDAIIRMWKDLPPARVNVTLYGASERSYHNLCGADGWFNRIADNIQAMKAAGIRVKLNCSLTPHNAADLEAIVRFSEQNELILSATPYMFPPVRRETELVQDYSRFTSKDAAACEMQRYRLQYGDEAYEALCRQLCQKDREQIHPDLEKDFPERERAMKCRAGRASFWVTWDGWLAACGMIPALRSDLTNKSFEEAWEEVKAQTAAVQLSAKCSSCRDRGLCHSCAAMAYAETGQLDGTPEYLCELAQEMKAHARRDNVR